MRNGLRVLGGTSGAIYVAIAVLSFAFRESTPGRERPLLTVLALFATACLTYLLALAWVSKFGGRLAADQTASTFREVLLFSILFRLLLLPTVPIQEVDFYRYLWDGRVLAQGLNPYEFSPAQIDQAGPDKHPRLLKFAAVRDTSATTQAIFEGVHHRQVSTIYPPLAQVLFATCATITPTAAPLWMHLLVLKALLLAVDIAILFAMRALLRHTGLADAWCLAYGWCPLAVKEVANSAHFDGLSVLATLIGLHFLLKSTRIRFTTIAAPLSLVVAGACLGLAILSKSYPMVLLPLFAASALACGRMRGLVAVVASCVVVIWGGYAALNRVTSYDENPAEFADVEFAVEAQGPLAGLTVFLTRWQMNDLLFMLVHENLRQPKVEPGRWFVVTPREWRSEISRRTTALTSPLKLGPQVDPAFIATQLLMGAMLLGIVFHNSRLVFRAPEPPVLLNAAFAVLAWSWMLGSAQNPWYVLWFLPLMPFARLRSWFLVPCLALIYYLRFWLIFQGDWNPATGECPAFDYGAVWLEHGIVLMALAIESWIRRRPREAASHSGTVTGSSSGFAASSFDASDA